MLIGKIVSALHLIERFDSGAYSKAKYANGQNGDDCASDDFNFHNIFSCC